MTFIYWHPFRIKEFSGRTFSCTRCPGSRGSCWAWGWRADAAASVCPEKTQINTDSLGKDWEMCDDVWCRLETNLPRFVKAPVSRGFNVAELFLVLRRCRPRGVRSRRRQHQEERMLRAPVLQEFKRPVCLHGEQTNTEYTTIFIFN